MLKKLIDKIYVEGPEQQLVEALENLISGNTQAAEIAMAAYIITQEALNGPLSWISHPEYVRADEIKITDNLIIGVVEYRNEAHRIEVIL